MTPNGLSQEFPKVDTLPLTGAGGKAHILFFVCVVACLGFGYWATVATLDIVSMAGGEVIPSSQVKSVQHLEGGIVLEISVREGDVVTRGQQLILLESTQSGADVGELSVRLLSLQADIARLQAEEVGLEVPEFAEDLRANHPRIVQQSLDHFTARVNSINSRRESQRAAVIQRQQEISEIDARIRNQTNTLKLIGEQVAIGVELRREGLSSRYVQLNLLKEESDLKGRNEADQATLKRAKAALKEARSRLKGIHTSYKEEIARKLQEARLNFDELTQRKQKYQDNLSRTTLRSPVDGVIKTMYVHTIGGILRPGGDVAEIVPVDDRLVIEARLATQDIGYVFTGQSAMVRLNSADAMRFGGLEGVVTSVSPDTLISEDGLPYYKVRIETEKFLFERGDQQYRLSPGMQVMASIRTGKRTVLEYISSPFLSSMGDALGER